MKTVTIKCTWTTRHQFEVDDDWECPTLLDGFTEEQLEEMTTESEPSLELMDWEAVK